MKICSIDVGIKNLAFCLFVKNEQSNFFHIEKWDVVNLSQKFELNCMELGCEKPAKFTKDSKCFCLKHSKKTNFLIPTNELKSSFINKQNIKSLYDIADKYNIKYEKPIKKADLISLINEYIYKICLEPIENVNASKMDLVTIGRNIQHKLDEILGGHLSSMDKVIIENQISPIANRMKTIQGMIAQYFIMKNNNISIDFVSATNKLKDVTISSDKEKKKQNHEKMTNQNNQESETKEVNDKMKKEKSNYKDRKKLGVETTLEMISNDFNYNQWISFFNKHTKKDDLSDCFLQGIWYISKEPIMQTHAIPVVLPSAISPAISTI